jgi:hypothetical protein
MPSLKTLGVFLSDNGDHLKIFNSNLVMIKFQY